MVSYFNENSHKSLPIIIWDSLSFFLKKGMYPIQFGAEKDFLAYKILEILFL